MIYICKKCIKTFNTKQDYMFHIKFEENNDGFFNKYDLSNWEIKLSETGNRIICDVPNPRNVQTRIPEPEVTQSKGTKFEFVGDEKHIRKTLTEKNDGWIYLLQIPDFKDMEIYKIGKTTSYKSRFFQYPRGTKIFCLIPFPNCHNSESYLLDVFKTKYQKLYVGNEYFKGDKLNMIEDIMKLKKKIKLNQKNL